MRTLIATAGLIALSACGQPYHLSADYGESYQATFSAQADRTRASAVDDQYALSGMEAMGIRMRVQEATSDEEVATPEATSTISVE